MKTTLIHIFVDDGYPEASDYDNNFVSYDPTVCGSCERALTEVKTRCRNYTPVRRFRYLGQGSAP
jgi:hypothetical protein